jgi:eukaryotic-like serine/threonine-protein kinase
LSKNLSFDSTIGHYRIESKLGAGAMGEVYLANDTRLDRKVALKILPQAFAEDAQRMSRFVREAKSASALNHPNIITIYEIGESEGTHFIATEFIDGKTLGDHAKASRLDYKEILEIAIQVASALQVAHAANIIHRDIKPDNVMIRADGLAKILDFGIAKLSAPTESGEEAATAIQGSTSPGMIIGTPNYMSPEQARGRGVNHQTDIFSFGVVFYEMLSGKSPFKGETVSDVIANVLTKEPEPLTNVPTELAAIVQKTLAKDKQKRYQTAKDLLDDLKEVKQGFESQRRLDINTAPHNEEPKTQILQATTTAAESTASITRDEPTIKPKSEIKNPKWWLFGLLSLLILVGGFFGYRYFTPTKQIESIAVMPFVNESGNADVEYLSDGMTETLINSLSQIPNLSVKARSSVFRYKGKDIGPKKIAAELNVQALLTGRVIQRGDQLTLNLELIDGKTENILWGNRFERKASELIALQTEITRDVSNRIKSRLSGADAARVGKNYTANSEAYQLYLKGRFYAIKRTAKDAKQAIEYYQQAVAIDPNYALAYAGLAEANWFLALYSYPQVNELVPKARELALKALELDDSLAEPHSVLGIVCNTYGRDFACMEREQKLAIELNPNYMEGHRRYSQVLEQQGRFEEARVALKRALEIDPLSPITNFEIANLLFYERKYEESEVLSKKNVELDPNFWYAHLQLFYVYRMKRDYASAVEALAKVQDARGEPDAGRFIRESFARGDWQGFLRKITGDRTQLKLYPYFVATFLAELGEKDKAFAALNEALETMDQHTSWMKVDPFLDPLRDDPRFKEVLRRAGFPE